MQNQRWHPRRHDPTGISIDPPGTPPQVQTSATSKRPLIRISAIRVAGHRQPRNRSLFDPALLGSADFRGFPLSSPGSRRFGGCRRPVDFSALGSLRHLRLTMVLVATLLVDLRERMVL